jgi:heme exporter protein D
LAAYAEAPPPAKVDSSPFNTPHAVSPNSSEEEKKKNNIADIVGFLSLGGDGAYVGSSSGFSLATNLGQMVQATVWNKALASTVSQNQPKAMTIADLYANSQPSYSIIWTIYKIHHFLKCLERSGTMKNG